MKNNCSNCSYYIPNKGSLFPEYFGMCELKDIPIKNAKKSWCIKHKRGVKILFPYP